MISYQFASVVGVGSGDVCTKDGRQCYPNEDCIDGTCQCRIGFLHDSTSCKGKILSWNMAILTLYYSAFSSLCVAHEGQISLELSPLCIRPYFIKCVNGHGFLVSSVLSATAFVLNAMKVDCLALLLVSA